MSINEIKCESAIHKLKRRNPYGFDLNIYRGCAHGCRYCYALDSHKYLDGDFHSDIYVKTNIVDALERELSAPGWNRDVINIGGVTDSYQPAEAQYKLMPEILRLLIKYRTPAIISTKSTLPLRDIELIDELSRITYINVAATITTLDEHVRIRLEPDGAPSAARFEMLKTLRQNTNASVGLHVMPIVPRLTDSAENLEALCRRAREAEVHYMLPGVMYLRGGTRRAFFDFIERDFPEHLGDLQAIYKTGGAGKEYKDGFYTTLNEIRDRYEIPRSYTKVMRKKMQ